MIEVYTDGASKGNPGPSGVGIYIKSNNEQYKTSIYIGEHTNHEAEFIAVIKALEYCQKNFSQEIISCRSDAKIVTDAVEKQHVKNKPFQRYLSEINALAITFPYFFMKWIPKKQNYNADYLARQALKNN